MDKCLNGRLGARRDNGAERFSILEEHQRGDGVDTEALDELRLLIAGKINYDEERQLIERFGIDTIPTLMLFKDGEVIGSIVAPASKAAIEAFIRETLAQ